MLFLALLLNSGLLFIDAYTVNEKNYCSIELNYRLPNHVIPKYYYIGLEILNEKDYGYLFSFSSKIDIEIQILQPTQNISLHAHPYVKIHKFMLMKENNNLISAYEPLKYEYCNKTEIVTLYFESTLSIGNYTLGIEFDNYFYNDIFYKTSYINKEGEKNGWLFVSHFKTIGARRLFPCWDEPKFTASFCISIRHHKNHTAESNMPLKKQYPDKNDMIWSIFHRTHKMPTYLVAVMLSDYHGRPYEKKVANVWCRKLSEQYIQFARDVARNVREYFYDNIDMKSLIYEPRVKHIVIPGYQYSDIENNWRLVFYRETDFIYNKETDPVAQKIKIAYLVARNMAYQWFCNLVSPSWWSDLWLNDGVATIFAIDAIDKVVANSQMLDLFVVQVQHESLYLDNYFIDSVMPPLISEINNLSEINSLSLSRHIKAPAIMRMLQHILTKEVFQTGFDIYLNNHMFQSATLDDFWTAMQSALDESPFKEYSFNVSESMDAWIKHRYYPVVNVIQDSPTQVIVSLAKSYMKSWWIPVSITTQTKFNFDETFFLRGQWIKSQNFNCTFSLPYEEDGWIIANLKQAGYYRVNYDYKNWQKIADYLNTPKYSNIHVLNRAQIIDDAFHFMLTKHLCPTMFWKLANYLSREKEYIAWYPMIKAIEHMSSTFSLPETRTMLIKRKIMHILDDLLTEIKYVEQSDDSDNMKSLRQESIKWACILGLQECIVTAGQALDQHLSNLKEHKILPSQKEWIYCNGIKETTNAVWTKAFRLWLTTRDSNILKSLTCTEKHETIYVILSALNKERSALELHVNNRINLYFIIIAKHITKDEILKYIINKTLRPREISLQAALTYIINHVNCKEHLNKVSTFVTENVESKLNSYIQHKIIMRNSQINKQIHYLQKLNNLLN